MDTGRHVPMALGLDRRTFVGSGVATLALGVTAQTQAASPVTELDFDEIRTMVADAADLWKVPGVSISIVAKGKSAFSAGFGVRKVGEADKVDADTIFAVASIAKSFAAATVGQLVGAGKLRWDDRVADHIPWFRLYDDNISAQVTIRDLLAMRTGLSESTALFRAAAKDRADLVRRMRGLRPAAAFRDTFAYSTDNYTVIGLIVDLVAQMPWENFVDERIFTPLGMSRTNIDHRVARTDINCATPHIEIHGKLSPISWIYEDHAAVPAGGINSSANDLARWMELLVGKGQWHNKFIIPPSAITEMTNNYTPEGKAGELAELAQIFGDGVSNPGYGLGLFVCDYHGTKLVQHGGVTDGFRSTMILLPEKGFGAAILTNGPHELFGLAVGHALADRALGLPDQEWPKSVLQIERYLQQLGAKKEEEAQADREAVSGAVNAALYVGKYRDSGGFGDVEIALGQDGLILDAGAIRFRLEPWRSEKFAATRIWPYPLPRAFFLTFDASTGEKKRGFRTSYGDFFAPLA